MLCGVSGPFAANELRGLPSSASLGFTGELADLKQGVVMTAIAHALSRTFHSAKEIDSLTVIVLICGAGLLVSLILLSRGVDLGPGFF